jgi:hypothetical protein
VLVTKFADNKKQDACSIFAWRQRITVQVVTSRLQMKRLCDNVQHSHVENKFVRSCYDVRSTIIFIQWCRCVIRDVAVFKPTHVIIK